MLSCSTCLPSPRNALSGVLTCSFTSRTTSLSATVVWLASPTIFAAGLAASKLPTPPLPSTEGLRSVELMISAGSGSPGFGALAGEKTFPAPPLPVWANAAGALLSSVASTIDLGSCASISCELALDSRSNWSIITYIAILLH